ncbi:YggS family pyridoxal phosphate-dependent enzyme [Candidatus Kaistella beijingensis]|uniref:YggS family pyridoxal phosphate-dependent enzyme n=1 Tax=Candidatus Kaistella beijingensis TaxID=2820270 RepID=UPI001CC475B5|nr:YggS family pyridoxal phosphate-dependent enzyme [Candidatus Kaistella beijingensis]UBB90162.1 YggS family pyridoxal phosphate-dependent enzyme [Candidatus Kaistella beijingensis]
MINDLVLLHNYQEIIKQIPENVQLVAVSKMHPVEKIQQVYDLGQRVFGENKVQELLEKFPLLPGDIQWHLIGHLQTNKVKYIAEFIDTIQSVDSEKLLTEIDKQAEKYKRKIKVLLQVKIAEEETKFGLEINEAKELFTDYLNGRYPNIEITGLMGMATFTEDKNQVRKEFMYLKQIFDQLSLLKKLDTLSMGMSDDFQIAINCGANSVRIGSAIFGNRNYVR